ncbi:MAG: MaoC family dehydratase N-terminal domain-containing protein [Alphaproteobacteria bacterium]|nr:MaoC family dehydratase N-terminal domain-containing protein [Alphaproteobacteria bacterium]
MGLQSFHDILNASVTCAKTVAESDVLLFAGITGDFSPNHVDEEAMRATAYGGRIAHGALLVGYMSRASTLIVEKCGALNETHYPVSLGYDRVRFLKGVRIGDTVTVTYTITALDAAKLRSSAAIEMKNQRGETVAVATHVLAWLKR